MNRLPPIPTPFSQRWREIKIRVLPALVFFMTALALVLLWNEHVSPPMMVGEVEPVYAEVISPGPGLLSNLWVTRFQQVKAGDVVAEVLNSDLRTSAQYIRSQAALARLEMNPLLDRQRNAFDYQRLRMDHLKQRVELATTKVNFQRAENELQRDSKLLDDQLISEDQYDHTLLARDALQVEVEEKSKLVHEMEQTLELLKEVLAGHTTGEDPNAILAKTLADLEASKLQFSDDTPALVPLRAPIDGVVTFIHRRSGENIQPGEPIMTISSAHSDQIIAFVRPPLTFEPEVGMDVQVRLRTTKRELGRAQILSIGNGFQAITNSSLTMPGLFSDVGLPLGISIPADLKMRPGELVDLTILLK
jgi:multidrug resistance efflux pump